MPTKNMIVTAAWVDITTARALVDGQAYTMQPKTGPVSWFEGAVPPDDREDAFLVSTGYPWRFTQGPDTIWLSAGGTKIVLNEA